MTLIASIRTPIQIPIFTVHDRRVDVQPLLWESSFFGARMGALVIAGSNPSANLQTVADSLARELRSALREAELEGYQHVSLRVAAEDVPAIWAAERAGLRLMDLAVDLRVRLPRPVLPSASQVSVRFGTPADIAAMRAITEGAFNMTRFGVDPFFSEAQVHKFYATWAANLFDGLADAVLISEVDGEVAGFASCKLTSDGTGRIPLVATSRAFLRRGIGRALVTRALAWFANAECSIAFVKTQAANYPALVLYEHVGFSIDRCELTFTTTFSQD